ncbi:hypothetical protein MM239_16795 [Belliella sp. DSM 111904]|uniref:Uncharacterized protein n=1 Tax=Belliella filtrata TaxID=2923435 RepID=A0ABS9V3U3_9BACT|nr:hypothetical protein [Belliella filtrata]MCH7411066.1 hypothetical protein [Belliella filtrata]
MKKIILLTLSLLVGHLTAYGQSNLWDVDGFTASQDIIIIDELPEKSEMKRGDLIFSKAKGVFSFSPINSINNRALDKLKTEASMKGASHIYITNQSVENSVFSKTSNYTARILKQKSVGKSKVENIIEGKTLTRRLERSFSRNAWKSKLSMRSGNFDLDTSNPIVEKNGKLYLKEKNSTNEFKHEIIAAETDKIIILEEKKKDSRFSTVILTIN